MTESLKYDAPVYVLAGIALVAILWLHLLAALLAGLLVHQLIHIVARKLKFVGVGLSTGKVAALTIISSATVLALTLATLGLTGLLSGQSESLLELMQKMADEIDTLRTHFPAWVQDHLPTDAEQLQTALTGTGLFERWRAQQEDPDEVNDTMAATDPAARVSGTQHQIRIDLVVDTNLPGEVLRQRLRLLAGSGWQLRDVT